MNNLNSNCSCSGQPRRDSGRSMVYLTKIFFDESENASPIMTAFCTSDQTHTQQFRAGSDIFCRDSQRIEDSDRDGEDCNCQGNCGCASRSGFDRCRCGFNNDCCCNFNLSPNTKFDITNAFVIVHSFTLADKESLAEDDVTVDGLPITDLDASGGQFMGDLSGIMPEITRCPCHAPCERRCPGNFVMIKAPGPWKLFATIVLEGTVFDEGKTCQFRLCFENMECSPTIINGNATFAFCDADIPCRVSGISPSLIFDFDACASILNPCLHVSCCGDSCEITLHGSLVVTPVVNLKIARPSLFNISAGEANLPCDDVGQCDICNPSQDDCFDIDDSCCCLKGRSRHTVDSLRNQTSRSSEMACQCCNTNGFRFL